MGTSEVWSDRARDEEMVEIRIGVHTAVAHVLDETRNYELVRRLERTETMTICESGDRKIQIPKRCSAMRMQIGRRGTRRSPSALRDFLFLRDLFPNSKREKRNQQIDGTPSFAISFRIQQVDSLLSIPAPTDLYCLTCIYHIR
jgi:hypothetical protein